MNTVNKLNVRAKWRSLEPVTIPVGDLVFLQEDNQPQLSWPIGRISELLSGPDGINRVAIVKTTRSNLKRALVKVYSLPKIKKDEADAIVTCETTTNYKD